MASYIVISPVKDEESYIEATLRSMTGQTQQPAEWVIVDDGSTDRTAQIVKDYAATNEFIRLVSHPACSVRHTGAPVIRAFRYGYSRRNGQAFDFIVKLDCDVSFGATYFETLLARLATDPGMGIASGVYLEADESGRWRQVAMPPYHAFGASKVVRRECFEQIGGFAESAGWDTLDEIRAWSHGWRTGHFADLEVKHHKREGSGIGLLKTSRMHGEIFYATGGDPVFFLFKCLHRVGTRPVLANAAALAAGYLGATLRRRPRLVSAAEARIYRRVLRSRLYAGARQAPPLPQRS